jgi:hypothetical protein
MFQEMFMLSIASKKECVAGSKATYKKYLASKYYHYKNVASIETDLIEKGP